MQKRNEFDGLLVLYDRKRVNDIVLGSRRFKDIDTGALHVA